MARKSKRKSDQPRNVGGTIIIRSAAEQRAYDRQQADDAQRDALIQHARDWMARHAPTMSVDVLTCQPDRAIELGLYVGERMQRLTPDQLTRLKAATRTLVKHQDAVDTVAAILRAVMNARKAGKLKGNAR